MVSLLSCNESPKAERDEPESDEFPEVTTSVKIFGNYETGDIFETYFRTEVHENGSQENCFFYSLDSLVRGSGKRSYVNEDFEPGNQSFCTTKSNDTLYVNFKASPPAAEYDQYKYYLIDSIDFQLTTRDMRIYCYVSMDKDPIVYATLYFSNELGHIYSHYPFSKYNYKYELMAHSSIEDKELTTIKDSLKVRSGESNKSDIDSKKKSP